MKTDLKDDMSSELSTPNNHHSIVQQVLTEFTNEINHSSTFQATISQKCKNITMSHKR